MLHLCDCISVTESSGNTLVRVTHLADTQLGGTAYHRGRTVKPPEHKNMPRPGLTNRSNVPCPGGLLPISPSLSGQGSGVFDGRCCRYVYTRCSNVSTRHCRLTVRDHLVFAHGGSADIVKQLVSRIVGAVPCRGHCKNRQSQGRGERTRHIISIQPFVEDPPAILRVIFLCASLLSRFFQTIVDSIR